MLRFKDVAKAMTKNIPIATGTAKNGKQKKMTFRPMQRDIVIECDGRASLKFEPNEEAARLAVDEYNRI